MLTRNLVTVAVLVNAVIGHLCMMPMAYASSMPMQHDEVMEMNMTPMVPMSPAHCEHCMHVAQESNAPMASSCAGHCLAKAHDSVAAIVPAFSVHHLAVALVPAFFTITEPADVTEVITTSTAPPRNLALARGVVMIQ